MKKIIALSLLFSLFAFTAPAFAVKSNKIVGNVKYTGTHGVNGKVSPKTVGAGALSLIIWPGIGQLMNDEENTDKAIVHALLGLTGIFRIWSCYDAVVDRKGGVWDNRI